MTPVLLNARTDNALQQNRVQCFAAGHDQHRSEHEPRPRDPPPKGRVLQQSPREKGCSIPDWLEASEVNALIDAAPNPQAGLLMLEQW